MNTTFITQTKNPHIEALRPVLLDAENLVEWLVIAHNGPQLLRSLDAALSGCSAAMLQISQDQWEFENSELASAISWAIERYHIRNLLLVGHSNTEVAESCAPHVNSDIHIDGETPVGYSRLVAGARYISSRNRDAQRAFSEHFAQLNSITAVQDSIRRDDLTTHGLIFRDEDRVFLEFDVEAEEYNLLLS